MKHELSDINPQKMDSQKWDMLLDLLEHPEKYSETQKDELLGDEEVNELYQLQVETTLTIIPQAIIDTSFPCLTTLPLPIWNL